MILAFLGLMGLLVGSLVNYLANSLLQKEDPLSGSSFKSYCQHKVTSQQGMPFSSFLRLSKSCYRCKQGRIFEYLIIAVLNSLAYCVLYWRFGVNANSIGLMFFISVLLAVCITDFKAKIIPHEITYPAIILGIAYSAQFRGDVLGALSGIGVSYILFDFLAFYGLQIYLWINKPMPISPIQFISNQKSLARTSALRESARRSRSFALSSAIRENASAKENELQAGRLFCKNVPVEELEVIGGGDAVLSALISAWLGWQKLVLALVASLLIGSVLGSVYLLLEIRKQRMLKSIIAPVISYSILTCLIGAAGLGLFSVYMRESIWAMPYLYVLPLSALVGCILAIMAVGSGLSKPFPFGPALAAGAIMAMFI